MPLFRSKVLADAGGASVATITPTEPAGATSDDVLILWIWLNAPSASTFVPPAGWTQFYGPQANGGSENYGLWIRRGGSAPSYLCSWTTNSVVECSVTCWSGCVTTGNPYDQLATAATANANPANPDPPAVTTTQGTLIVVLGTGFVLAIPWVAPTGYTIRESGGVNWGRVCAASKDLPTPGTENPASFTNGDTNSRPIWAATMALTAGGVIPSTGAYAQESSTSDRYQLEDGSGVYLIEPWGTAVTQFPPRWWGDLDGIGKSFPRDRLN